MKCKNCGGEVPSLSKVCPYCNTINEQGESFLTNIFHRRRQNETLKEYIKNHTALEVANKILGRAVLILGLLFLLVVIISFAVYYSVYDGPGDRLFPGKAPSNAQEVMQELYENGEYGKLDDYFYEENVEPQDFYELYQITVLYSKYNDFLQSRNDVIEQIESNTLTVNYIEWVIEDVFRLSHDSLGLYSDLTEKNQKIHEKWVDEAKDFILILFQTTQDEYLDIFQPNSEERVIYLDSGVATNYANTVLKRIGGASHAQ